MLVAAVVVEDRVNHLPGWHRPLDGAQKAQELLVPVTLHAAADHGALEHVERGEQGGGAVALVVVGQRAGLAWLDRQTRLGAIERLDLGLLVDRKHDRMLGRGHIEADDVLELGRELRITRALEGAQAMRLQVVRRPDPLHRAQADPGGPGHGAPGPMGRLARRLGTGQRDHALHRGIAQRRLARLAGRIAQQALDAGLREPPLPAPYRRPADPGVPRHLGGAQLLGRCQDDPSPRHVLLGAVAIGDDRLEASTIRSRHQRANDLSHAPSMPQPRPFVNLMIASVH